MSELLEGMYDLHNFREISETGEGKITWFPERVSLLKDLISRIEDPRTLIEVGFNLGHSAKIVCDNLIKRDNTVNRNFYIFDICFHGYIENNFEIMKNHYKKFNITLFLIKGSSLDTLEKTLNELNIIDIDFANIDGLHTPEGVTNDFNAIKDRMRKNGIIHVDDYNSIQCPEIELSIAIDKLDWSSFESDSIIGVKFGKKK